MPADAIAYLRRFPLFASLDEKDLQRIAPLASERHYRGDMFVLVEGEPVDGVFFLRNGTVKATRSSADGREQIISVLGSGDFFPHVGLLDGGPAPATVRTLSEADISVIRRPDFVELLRQNSDITQRVLVALEQRIRMLQNQVLDLGLKTVPARLAGALLELAAKSTAARAADMTPIASGEKQGRKPSEQADERITLDVHLSQQELANMVGATRETVSRVFADFRRSGVITLEKDGCIVIHNAAQLRRWAHGLA